MTSSLVGSEMCIRDRRRSGRRVEHRGCNSPRGKGAHPNRSHKGGGPISKGLHIKSRESEEGRVGGAKEFHITEKGLRGEAGDCK
eukprot:44639-Prorocentrum_lima.AAC.1